MPLTSGLDCCPRPWAWLRRDLRPYKSAAFQEESVERREALHMFNRHPTYGGSAAAERIAPIRQPVPTSACCCPARPVVLVMMPPAPGRPRAVDLWLCAHHYRESATVLDKAGAIAEDLTSDVGELSLMEAAAAV